MIGNRLVLRAPILGGSCSIGWAFVCTKMSGVIPEFRTLASDFSGQTNRYLTRMRSAK
ncbi:hypothetical protein SAMN05444287_3184 [Octadecabacter temperatus]|uniref:Uncharacterized protein n=1 Tax=Octadecabacter temperatus TaxID=1458307 RepID=A0A0K0Y882_9RHOB|nr:hypothetical protein OSB_26520 [Octadecabacter temperatus]SIO45644.1 hypothetical protein SAMN05444287_3184 [Octadecabacter temperatus]